MKISTLAFTAITASNVALAQPHKHQHAHFHDINKRTQTATSYVSGPTAYAFVLDGQSISIDEVCAGVASNQLKWADGAPAGLCSSSSSTSPSSTSLSSVSSVSSGGAFFQKPTNYPSGIPSGFPSGIPSGTGSSPAAASSWTGWSGAPGGSSTTSSSSSINTGGATGVTAAFPDGELDCSTFPSQYGAMALDYLGLGGWSGLQSVTFGASAFSNIVTGISGQTCSEGMMCSYACPAGYQKSQWPATQGATGQSVGGIQCSGGKLHLTNPSLSSSLCIPGMGGVQVTNNAGGVVAICRTDYPGTESETIPVEVDPGQTQPLANPNAATYYTWQGSGTSAQYYLNPIGTSAQAGCQWGSSGSNIGNWAPINFGVGYSGGKTWLSIFQNKPTTYVSYAGTVSIQGDISASCTYSNGQYCGAAGCNSDGCTVAVNSGTATFVVSQ